MHANKIQKKIWYDDSRQEGEENGLPYTCWPTHEVKPALPPSTAIGSLVSECCKNSRAEHAEGMNIIAFDRH